MADLSPLVALKQSYENRRPISVFFWRPELLRTPVDWLSRLRAFAGREHPDESRRRRHHCAQRSLGLSPLVEHLEPRIVLSADLPLLIGEIVSDEITVPGEQDCFTFTLSSETRLYFDSFSNNSSLSWSLSGPAGSVVINRPFTSSDSVDISNPVIAAVAGDYTLTVDAIAELASPYSFRVVDLDDAGVSTLLTPGTIVNGTLDPANETDFFRLDVQAGDRLTFDALGPAGAGNARWRLIDPFNSVVFETSLNTDVETLTLNQPGTYLLLVEGRYFETGSGDYSFNVRNQPEPLVVIGDDNPADITLRRNGIAIEVVDTVSQAVLASRSVDDTSDVQVFGGNQNDILRVDFSGGSIPVPILVDGGAGNDTLILTGGSFDTAIYRPTGVESGFYEMDDVLIVFAELEPIIDETSVANRIFSSASLGGQQIRLTDDGDSNNGLVLIDDNGTGAFESVTFNVPASSLVIEGGDGDGLFTVEVLDQQFLSPIILIGGNGDDAFQVVPDATASITVVGGSHLVGDQLTVDARQSAAVDTGSVVQVSGFADVAYSGVESINLVNAPPTVTLSLEGSPLAENGGVATLTATLSEITTQDVTVQLAFAGDASLGPDYSVSFGSIGIVAGELSGSITLTAQDDPFFEGDETAEISIDAVTNAVVGSPSLVSAVILDDETTPSVSLSLEGSPLSENGGQATVTATLTHLSVQDVTVNLGFAGTATNVDDYTRSVDSIVISAGSLSGSVTLTGVDDALDELDETVVLDVTSVTNGTEDGVQQVTALITDDDSQFDFGDAPESYGTLGTSHRIIENLFIGGGVDAEPAAQPDADAQGDDTDGNDDEDGQAFLSVLSRAAAPTEVTGLVDISLPVGVETAFLDAWIDYNGDGFFSNGESGGPSEHIFGGTSLAVSGGINIFDFIIPATTGDGDFFGETFARIRLSLAGGLGPTGPVADGEVEDYKIEFVDDQATAQFVQALRPIINQVASNIPGEATADSITTTPGQDVVDDNEFIRQIIGSFVAAELGAPAFFTYLWVDPVDFILTDPQGRRAGFTQAEGAINEIGNDVRYSGDGVLELLVIPNSDLGLYEIQLFGLGFGFRGGINVVSPGGVQIQTFEGSLLAGSSLVLALDFSSPLGAASGTTAGIAATSFDSTIPIFSSSTSPVSDPGARGFLFNRNLSFNLPPNDLLAFSSEAARAIQALRPLDFENESRPRLTAIEHFQLWVASFGRQRGQLQQMIEATLIPFFDDAPRRDALDQEAEDDLELKRSMLDAFWSGVGRTLLGIPGELFDLGDILDGLDGKPQSNDNDETPAGNEQSRIDVPHPPNPPQEVDRRQSIRQHESKRVSQTANVDQAPAVENGVSNKNTVSSDGPSLLTKPIDPFRSVPALQRSHEPDRRNGQRADNDAVR